jgi:dolichol kinase
MTEGPVQARKTPFVTIIAWVFIALATMILMTSVIQFIAVAVLNYGDMHNLMVTELKKSMKDSDMLELALLAFRYAWIFVAVIFLYAITLLLTSIALLKRREWARKTMVVLLGIAIFYELSDLAWQFYVMNNTMAPLMKEMPGLGGGIMAIILGIITIMVLAFCALFVWVITKLLSEKIRQEFATQQS